MRKFIFIVLTQIVFFTFVNGQNLPSKESTLNAMRITNQYFMNKWPDPGKTIVVDSIWPKTQHNYPIGQSWKSSIWTRAVYYNGLMALYEIDPQQKYLDYITKWGDSHQWRLNGDYSRHADNHCAGKVFIRMYELSRNSEYIKDTKLTIDSIMKLPEINRSWTWIDAIYMAMPVFARLGKIYNDKSYFERMYTMYVHTKYYEGNHGLYNKEDGLWWRDKKFLPPYKEPNGQDCYWSRGNGWVIAALCEALELIPKDEIHRKEYIEDLRAMANALIKVQREDGFWNASLHDPNNYGGKETTGTSLFVYAMAWGVNNGILNEKTYKPVIANAWNAILNDAVHPNGFLGYVQGTGHEPASSQPVGYNIRPDFEDFGLGCFLIAAKEVYLLSSKEVKNK